MTPFWQGPDATFYHGDALAVLRELPSESVQCCVTSPPYWGLRDYGNPPSVWGGDAVGCEHEWGDVENVLTGRNDGGRDIGGRGGNYKGEGPHITAVASGSTCLRCGAWRGCLGLEPIPDCQAWARGEPPCASCFVCHLRAIFAEVRRVLCKDGVLFLNLGDSYAGSGKGPTGHNGIGDAEQRQGFVNDRKDRYHRSLMENVGSHGARLGSVHGESGHTSGVTPPKGLKPKDLIGVPWRVAFALQADGWWLRQDNIWAKRAPMPESVTDRSTRSHEYVFQLTKSERYYYCAEAVKEESVSDHPSGNGYQRPEQISRGGPGQEAGWTLTEKRNQRSVWILGPEPYAAAHFATYPTEIPRRCILAGSRPSDVVLDPFLGSGTTALVARQLGRYCIGIDLNATYLSELATARIEESSLPLPLAPTPVPAQLALEVSDGA